MTEIEHSAEQETLLETTISRRQLLKALVAAGGGIAAATLLPQRWTEPAIELGALPAHAQASPTPMPIAAIVGCEAYDVEGGANIYPWSVIRSRAWITPALGGIQLRQTITLNQPGHPQNGVVRTLTGPTVAGSYEPLDFDLAELDPLVQAGNGRMTIQWEFVNPADGTNSCENSIDVLNPN